MIYCLELFFFANCLGENKKCQKIVETCKCFNVFRPNVVGTLRRFQQLMFLMFLTNVYSKPAVFEEGDTFCVRTYCFGHLFV